jgi:ribonuclease T2
LWPQNDNGSWPQDCSSAQPVSQEIVREMLPVMPARGLIQHEWAKHGTCSGLSVQDYFGEIIHLYKEIKAPPEYQNPNAEFQVSPSNIEQKFAAANAAPQNAFRISCRAGEFVALEVCYDKEFRYRDCGALKECRAPQVRVLPTP